MGKMGKMGRWENGKMGRWKYEDGNVGVEMWGWVGGCVGMGGWKCLSMFGNVLIIFVKCLGNVLVSWFLVGVLDR